MVAPPRETPAVQARPGCCSANGGIPAKVRAPAIRGARLSFNPFWVAVKELKLSYHNSKTIIFIMDPYDGNLI